MINKNYFLLFSLYLGGMEILLYLGNLKWVVYLTCHIKVQTRKGTSSELQNIGAHLDPFNYKIGTSHV